MHDRLSHKRKVPLYIVLICIILYFTEIVKKKSVFFYKYILFIFLKYSNFCCHLDCFVDCIYFDHSRRVVKEEYLVIILG